MVPPLPLDVLSVVAWNLPTYLRRDISGLKDLAHFLEASRLCCEAASANPIWKAAYDSRYLTNDPQKEAERKERYDGDYRLMYSERQRMDAEALEHIETIIEKRAERAGPARRIVEMGFDVWDVLEMVTYKTVPPFFSRGDPPADELEWRPKPHALTRRYWANRMRKCINRVATCKFWASMIVNDEAATFEDSLNSISGFSRVHPKELTSRFEELTVLCCQTLSVRGCILDPNDPRYNLRSLCCQICQWMADFGFKGAVGDSFQKLLNKIPHHYLFPEKVNGSIPMSLGHIFYGIATRLGIKSSPTNFPFKLLMHVTEAGGTDFLLDCYNLRSPLVEISRDVPAILASYGVPQGALPESVLPCSARESLLRQCLNILNALSADEDATGEIRGDATFASACLQLMVGNVRPIESVISAHLLDSVDYSVIIQDTLAPVLDKLPIPANELELFTGRFSSAQAEEAKSDMTIKKRSRYMQGGWSFSVGTVFLHRKYEYIGVITGWDQFCMQSDEWMRMMSVDSLNRGRNQPFYNTCCSQGAVTYVAEENITPISVEPEDIDGIFEHHPQLYKLFEDVQFEDVPGSTRLVPSVELQQKYPQDLEAGEAMMESNGLFGLF